MSEEDQIQQLEQALLRQAESLAREHMHNAESARARIQAESRERLRLREEREILSAKAEAERLFRRRIQAAETHLAAELDRMRWALTQSVIDQVRRALAELTRDEGRYLDVLYGLFAAAVAELREYELVVEVTPADRDRLDPVWDDFVARAAPGRRVELIAHGQPSLGGLRVRDLEDRVRLDQTFEARLERLADVLAQRVMERLFASAPDLGTLVRGG